MYRERMYDPEEVRRILREASDQQDAEQRSGDGEKPGRPMTLDDIAALARDAGIREDIVRRVAAGPPGRAALSGAKKNWLAGAPLRVVLERTVTGVVVPANHAQLVGRMRRALGEAGRSEVLGESLAWSTAGTPSSGGRSVHVSLEPDGDGRVTLRVEERMTALAGGLFGGVFGGVGGGGLGVILPAALAVSPPAMFPAVVALWLLTVFVFARWLFTSRVRAREAELSALLEDLSERVGAPLPVGASPPRARIVAPPAWANAPAAPPGVRVSEGEPVEEPAEDEPEAEGANAHRRR